jgi:hypothetical protein
LFYKDCVEADISSQTYLEVDFSRNIFGGGLEADFLFGGGFFLPIEFGGGSEADYFFGGGLI